MTTSFLLFIAITAIVAALLEIQIEGSAGWAKNLPTWRSNPKKWHGKMFRLLFNQSDVTGYHIAFWAFVLTAYHGPLFWDVAWSISLEADILTGFLIFWVLEDFLWFVFNPHYGIRKFNPRYIPWHKRWIGPFPVQYYTSAILVVLLSFI
ncbi:MAG: hypothetical protein COU47_02770 [Candidatus Niyogibacteria bacterium CG10_big_fil_rev_8_21_14_0_10_46_36]|uniref:Uncharacterized protein n=1 Tax=Candidatus Niyogibacteria bacterium CG10_big_fil_rev_8_21_14_0_10_46_36 TaxID=1974726 RepID=A0A2H0TF84_9BACT|nr:MAG: hypothetical protein COU47_02770 [Candidatus Niyogibacteria bacterium CG10_big_fil_rev_8_21_14_0_10_46_36]